MNLPGPLHELQADVLLHGLRTRRVGRAISVLSETSSTNDYVLRQIVALGAASDGHVVFAEHQSAGRGRLGRSWASPRGASLLFSVLLRDDSPRLLPARVAMASALAVAEGIDRATDVEPALRWPNDVYARNKKLAGILVETRDVGGGTRAVVVGVGVNCLQQAAHFPPDLRHAATSLHLEAAHAVDRSVAARAILRAMDAYFAEPDRWSDDKLVERWHAWSADVGARVELLSDGRRYSGRIVDVHPVTGLLLRHDGGGPMHFDPMTTTRS